MKRAGIALLVVASVYLVAVFTAAILRTAQLEHDSAYYCEVTERWLDGQGFTSLSDRRGPADPLPFPQGYHATNRWPWVLAALGTVTGEVAYTAMFASLAAFVAALWLAAWIAVRMLGANWLAAALCVVPALCHRRSVDSATLPLTDSFSLLLNLAVVAALLARRNAAAVGLVGLACVARFQNLALLLPVAWCVLESWRWRTAVMALGVAAGLAWASPHTVEGVVAFLSPSDKASLFRAVRWMFVPMLAGMLLARGTRASVLTWLLAGHFLVLLAHKVPTEVPAWLFGMRHGWPFHAVAGIFAAVALSRAAGLARIALALLVLVAAVDTLPRTYEIARDRPQRTDARWLAPMLESLRREPLPEDAVVLSHEADVLARTLAIRSIHLRGFQPSDPELARKLRERGVTHVLLRWIDIPVLSGMNERMDALRDVLAPAATELRTTTTEEPASRIALYGWAEPDSAEQPALHPAGDRQDRAGDVSRENR